LPNPWLLGNGENTRVDLNTGNGWDDQRMDEADLYSIDIPGRELGMPSSSPVRPFNNVQSFNYNIDLRPIFFGKFSLGLTKSSKNGE
jgi:hypothetical protein